MIPGAFPLGVVPVGAGAAFTVTPVAIGGRATINGAGRLKLRAPNAAKARSTLATQAHGRLSSTTNHIGGHASLFTDARGVSGLGPSHINARALNLSVSARARTRAPFHLSGSAKRSTITKGEAAVGITGVLLPVFPVLPPLAWSVHKKPIAASRVTTGVTGRDNQLAGAVYPRWAFTLTYGGNSWLRDRTQNIVPDLTKGNFVEFEQLSGLFILCLGPEGEFLYNDPDDNSRSKNTVGLGDGLTTVFPILISWGFGPFTPSFASPVGAINTVETVYFDNVVQSPTLYSISLDRTSINFASAPPSGVSITADLHFYFRCRFLDDHLDFSQWAVNLWECKEVRFESVKP